MATSGQQDRPSLLGRLNDRAKALNDRKVNAVTVVVFFAGLAVLAGVATGIGYVMHKAVKGIERPSRH